MSDTPEHPSSSEAAGERVAKALARAGIASRREAERLIEAGRVALNGKTLTSPAVKVMPGDELTFDGQPIGPRPPTQMWLYHKPNGLLTTHADPEGRATVFEQLPDDLGRVISVGRLDMNSEGLMLLTNDGALARVLELPATGWTRRYRVRAYGNADDRELAKLADGVVVEGVVYGPIEVTVDRRTGANVWLTVGIKEGKNREVRKVLAHVGLTVNRLMRVAYGPFQLGNLKRGEVTELKLSVLRDQLGKLYPLDNEGNPTDTHVAAPATTGKAKAKPKPGRKTGWAKATKKSEPGHKARKRNEREEKAERGELTGAKPKRSGSKPQASKPNKPSTHKGKPGADRRRRP
ncbi:rRNA pseudouridine synthase [Maricaulaceae bacterium NA33B04]|nr:rRNA pseudouridine synthase [Maricaulaceae bacterium NA33B04]